MILGLVLGPDTRHRLDRLGQEREACAWFDAVVSEVHRCSSRLHAEDESASREAVERRDSFRRQDDVSLGDDARRRPSAEAIGHGGG